MKCSDVKHILREDFDHGRERSPDVGSHVDGCADCRAYVLRLEELEQAMFSMPVEAVDVAFVTDLRNVIAKEQSVWKFKPVFLRVAAVALTLCAALFGWQYTFIVGHASTGWNSARAWFSIEDLINLDQSVSGMFSTASTAAMQILEPLSGISPFVQWICIAAAGSALVAFNGIEFLRLRVAGNSRT